VRRAPGKRLEIGRDGALEQSAQLAFAQGIALRWQMLGEPRRQNGCVYVRVRAEVVPLESLQTPADWREVWQTVGHPPLRLTLRYTGELALEGHARQSLHAALRHLLSEMGVRPSDPTGKNHWQLIAELELEPITRWGDANAPYGWATSSPAGRRGCSCSRSRLGSREPVLLDAAHGEGGEPHQRRGRRPTRHLCRAHPARRPLAHHARYTLGGTDSEPSRRRAQERHTPIPICNEGGSPE
jgi:hypothetical protein